MFAQTRKQKLNVRYALRKKRIRSRLGASVVELAIALPPLFFIVFASIQASNAIFLQQFITEVGYQGALSATRQNATEAGVESSMQALLTARGVSGATVELSGPNGESFGSLTSDQLYRVRVSVPADAVHTGPNLSIYSQLTSESYGRRP